MNIINIPRELNLMVKYVTFNHCNMSSNLIALILYIKWIFLILTSLMAEQDTSNI